MTVGRICSREVYLVDEGESLAEAALRMRERNVGTLVVTNDQGMPIGILTDRDIAIHGAAPGLAPEATRVGEVISRNPRTLGEDAPIEDALQLMRVKGIRRLPVVDGAGRLVGLVSLDDILHLLTEEMTEVGRLLDRQEPFSSRPQLPS